MESASSTWAGSIERQGTQVTRQSETRRCGSGGALAARSSPSGSARWPKTAVTVKKLILAAILVGCGVAEPAHEASEHPSLKAHPEGLGSAAGPAPSRPVPVWPGGLHVGEATCGGSIGVNAAHVTEVAQQQMMCVRSRCVSPARRCRRPRTSSATRPYAPPCSRTSHLRSHDRARTRSMIAKAARSASTNPPTTITSSSMRSRLR